MDSYDCNPSEAAWKDLEIGIAGPGKRGGVGQIDLRQLEGEDDGLEGVLAVDVTTEVTVGEADDLEAAAPGAAGNGIGLGAAEADDHFASARRRAVAGRKLEAALGDDVGGEERREGHGFLRMQSA